MDAKYFLPVAFAMTLSYNRKAKRLSQDDLAKQAGISRSHIWKLENASTNPSVETMLKLSKAFSLDLERFGGQLQSNYTNVCKVLEGCAAETGAKALHLYIKLNNNPLRKN